MQVTLAQSTSQIYPEVTGFYEYNIFDKNDGFDLIARNYSPNVSATYLYHASTENNGQLTSIEDISTTSNTEFLNNDELINIDNQFGTGILTYQLTDLAGNVAQTWTFNAPAGQVIRHAQIEEFPDGDIFLSYTTAASGDFGQWDIVDIHYGKYNKATGAAAYETTFDWVNHPLGNHWLAEIYEVGIAEDNSLYFALEQLNVIRSYIFRVDSMGNLGDGVQVSSLERYVQDLTPTSDGGVWYWISQQGSIGKVNADATFTQPYFSFIDQVPMGGVGIGTFVAGPAGTTYMIGSVTPFGTDQEVVMVLAIGDDGSDLSVDYFTPTTASFYAEEGLYNETTGCLTMVGRDSYSPFSERQMAFLQVFCNDNDDSDCPESLDGYTLVGEYENSQYYISNEKAQWNTANANAETIAADLSINAHLATISSQAENDFIQNNVDEIVGIGFNDITTEATIEWVTDEPVTFANIDSDCGWCPGNTEENDFGIFYPWNGKWDFDNQWVSRYYLIEVECANDPVEDGITFTCPEDVYVTGLHANDYTETVFWDVPIATTTCPDGDLTITQIAGLAPGVAAYTPVPSGHPIVYEITDACGNSEQCLFFVYITPEDPIYECPNDIVMDATSANGAVVEYDAPTMISYCTIGGYEVISGLPSGSEFPIGTTIVQLGNILNGGAAYCGGSQVLCTFTVTVNAVGGGHCPDQIDDFDYLGDYNGSAYFLSEGKLTWMNAADAAVSAGGHLAVINSQAENDFIQENINDIAIIGFSDSNIEGTIEWITGEAVTFNNVEDNCTWCPGNSENNDFGIIYPWSGTWDFDNQWVTRKYLVEIACDVAPPAGFNVECHSITMTGGGPANDYLVQAYWEPPTATTDCPDGELLIEQLTSEVPGASFYPPTVSGHPVVYKITDACGNEELCVQYFYPDAGDSVYDCSADITVTANSPAGAIVEYDDPVLTSFCTGLSNELIAGLPSGSEFPIGTTVVGYKTLLLGPAAFCQVDRFCSFTVTVLSEDGGNVCDEQLAGYEYVGTFENSSYYITDEVMGWQSAQDMATSNGGYLPSITTPSENDFIQNAIGDIAFIGLNDLVTEESSSWINGETFDYNNTQTTCGWCPGNTPDNDYGLMYPWNGEWDYVNNQVLKKGLMERPCSSNIGESSQALQFSQQPSIQLHRAFPNPANTFIRFQFSSYKEVYANMHVYDLTGKLVKTIPFEMYNGRNEVKLDVRNMQDGIYFTKIDGVRGSEFKFVVATGY